jgi:hypothetical protein
MAYVMFMASDQLHATFEGSKVDQVGDLSCRNLLEPSAGLMHPTCLLTPYEPSFVPKPVVTSPRTATSASRGFKAEWDFDGHEHVDGGVQVRPASSRTSRGVYTLLLLRE